MLAHIPSFGRNPRDSPDFLAYPVPKACMHVLGTRVPRRFGVARSASSPKADNRSPVCAKPDEVEAEVEVVVEELKLSSVVVGAMVQDALGNMQNKW